jgi:tetratricopeptide (TPR) repeat protein
VGAYHNNYGFSLYLAGRYDQALDELQEALELEPTLAMAINNLGFAFGAVKRYTDAARMFQQVGTKAEALINLSLAYERNGEADKATELRERAYQLEPDLREDKQVGAVRASDPLLPGKTAPASETPTNPAPQPAVEPATREKGNT